MLDRDPTTVSWCGKCAATAALVIVFSSSVVGVRGAEPPRLDEWAAYQKVSRALDQRTDVDFHGAPLTEVARELQKRLGLPVLIDRKSLTEVAIPVDTPMTLKVHGASGHSVLKYLLRPHSLDYVVRDEVVSITTPEVADEYEMVVMHDVADLVLHPAVRADGKPGFAVDFDSLIILITMMCSPTAWPDGTGPGPIRPFEAAGIHVLIIRQIMPRHHEEIAELLDVLRAARHGDPPVKLAAKAGDERRPRTRAERAATVNKVLDAKIDVDFRAIPRSQAIARFADQAKLPLVIDRVCFDDAAVTMALPVTLHASGKPVREILDELLRNGKEEVGWVIDRDLVLVTTEEELDCHLETRVYDVTDLPAFRTGSGQTVPDFDALIGTITSTLAPKTWSNRGGCGSIASFHQCGIQALVVSHTAAQHERIGGLLAKLRKVRGPLSKEAIQNLPLLPPPKPTPGGGFF